MNLTDLFEQNLITPTALGLLANSPVIVPTAANLQNLAHPLDRKLFTLSSDKGVLHLSSLAKYAAAFFRMSRSSLTRSNSLRSRLSSSLMAGPRPFPGKACSPR